MGENSFFVILRSHYTQSSTGISLFGSDITKSFLGLRVDIFLVKRQINERKVSNPWFDFQTGNASLCSWKRHFTLIFLWGQAVYSLWRKVWQKTCKQNPKKCSGLVWLGWRRVSSSHKQTKSRYKSNDVLDRTNCIFFHMMQRYFAEKSNRNPISLR